ncbi:MAG: hypothetical protein CL424_10135 [Acidimicrobiaceae bacterium]|nr:hypothetical protein [Acidimicrobiaceae bacterium]
MIEQHDQSDDDVAGHRYVPKDERAGAGGDTEAHGRRLPEADDADDAEGHGRRTPDADDVPDVQGHGRPGMPGDPINEPSSVRGRDAQGRR